MLRLAYAGAVLIDTSAIVALVDDHDAYHSAATECFNDLSSQVSFCAVDVTAHESFTRLRYAATLKAGLSGFNFLRETNVRTLQFNNDDEQRALELVRKYSDKKLSYHDALCAAVMLRHNMFRIFSFDSDFWVFGFELCPGATRPR